MPQSYLLRRPAQWELSYPEDVRSPPRRRIGPFATAAVILLIVAIAMIQLPDSFVSQLERNRPLSTAQSEWAFRLMVLAAVAQAAYGGFVLIRVERVRKALLTDPKVARMSRAELLASVERNAATMTVLTLIYGISAFAVTGDRAGFWFFPLVQIAQAAWYYRQIGDIARWLSFQPETAMGGAPGEWKREPSDYCPPLARGLVDVSQSRDSGA
jgi:hypothetical protein